MRRYVTVVPLLLLASSALAQTRELTLGCSGKSENGNETKDVPNLSLVVNLTRKTVTPSFYGMVANITGIDDANIVFKGKINVDPDKAGPTISNLPTSVIMEGRLDRITGNADIFLQASGWRNSEMPSSTAHLS